MSDEMLNEGDAPFPRPFPANRIASGAVDTEVSANDDEKKALAELWSVDTVHSVSADLHISVWRREGLRIRGTATAKITQSCVVTLEPIETDVVEEIDATFLPENSRQFRRMLNEDGELVVDPDGPDEPEVFSGHTIDLGAVVAESIALGIDPYPRKDGVALDPQMAGEGEEQDDDPKPQKESPFAVLKGLKNTENSDD